MKYSIVVKGHFDAAHRLPGVKVCERLHGHSFLVECKVSSTHLNFQDMVCDFQTIKGCWNQFDHQYLNEIAPFTMSHLPTAENIAAAIFNQINLVVDITVDYVRVWESPDAYAEVTND